MSNDDRPVTPVYLRLLPSSGGSRATENVESSEACTAPVRQGQLDYIAALIHELQAMAQEMQHRRLAVLLAMAHREAGRQAPDSAG